ncbi:Methyltransferase domain-containing protein [Granulicella rosea]|uniref:Methyltransferase domain-containing protein n=1 Tax=Granulicella rosea TaxID=474952 RepID=A0A239DHK9_9BACT|nr:class I SAM-dependent methyltransferase [Granulicella rosea]SNS31906.1 Methyltransferase domain-containing protein [Granulicella rosea]
MTTARLSPTFRDPAGSLLIVDNSVVRTIHPSARQAVLEFLASPFCLRMQERGDMVASIVDETSDTLQLHHPKIAIPTYPWEWTPSQWVAAAELTLSLAEEGLKDGWILKDATPLNVLFVGARPVFVDILSFERHDPTASIWLAYGQYMRTFLLPLLTHRMLAWPLSLSLFKRDGYEPIELYAALGWRQRLSRTAFWPITLPALLEKRKGSGDEAAKPRPVQKPELALHILRGTLKDLRARTRRALPEGAATEWSDYTTTLTHYTAAESDRKRAWMRHTLTTIFPGKTPGRVLDIGANTGEFSALAAEAGAEVIAIERDGATADKLFRMSREKGLNIQTIHADISRPTPAAGWEYGEQSALLPRLEEQFDLVLMLAVIHHLVLMEQIPLPAILELCHRLTRSHLVIEWVPAEDPMYKSLMRGRTELYGGLTEADLLAATGPGFDLLEREALANGRVLFLFQKRVS